jgi:hypothetical protein
MSQDPERGRQRPDDYARLGPAAFDSQLGDLVAYCRALTGRDDDAVSTAREVLDSARSLLTDPRRLRAWLFALARLEITAASAPQPREIFDLVHRHGFRPADLPVVLGVSPAEADELLAAAEEEAGWDDRPGHGDHAYLEGQHDLPGVGSRGDIFEALLPGLIAYCREGSGREETAVRIARGVMDNAQSLLTDPGRLRAWLFATARTEAVGDAEPSAMEILDLVHRHGISAGELPRVLGIPPIESDELLAAAEEAYASGAFGSGPRGVDSGEGDGWQDDWDEVFEPRSQRWYDAHDAFRTSSQSAGRHAATGRGGALRQALARGPVRVAAATGIVVAVIGVSTAYLASFNGPPPNQAGHQARHHAVAAPSPATARSTAPTPAPAPTTPQPVTVVLPPPPPPASTSPRPSPKPSPKPASSSPKPSPSPSPSRSSSPSPSPSTSPSPRPG